MNDNTINSFRGYYDFLSNMYPSPIKLGGVQYTCAEAAFQAVKLADKSKRSIFAGISGKEAKALGRRVELRPDWNEIRINVMRWIISEKFKQNKSLKLRLIRSTSNCEIIEGNTWNDTFWGVCNGRGQNWLGKILMEERAKVPDTSNYRRIDKENVPASILLFIKRLLHEENEAGYEMKNVTIFSGEYYKIEYDSVDPLGVVHEACFVVDERGEDSIQLKPEW